MVKALAVQVLVCGGARTGFLNIVFSGDNMYRYSRLTVLLMTLGPLIFVFLSNVLVHRRACRVTKYKLFRYGFSYQSLFVKNQVGWEQIDSINLRTGRREAEIWLKNGRILTLSDENIEDFARKVSRRSGLSLYQYR